MNTELQNINDVINLYFKGTYQGNADQLKKAFHPDARITGILNDQYYDWSLADFISRVTTKPTAENKHEQYNKEIVMIDITSHAAIVKARVVVGGLIFTDYITLLKINNTWAIRNKSFISN